MIGGGVSVESRGAQVVNESTPNGTTSWRAETQNTGSVPHGMTVTAICALVREAR